MFDKIKSSLEIVQETAGVSIPISSNLLTRVLEKYQADTIENPQVQIDKEVVIISGTAMIKKFGISKKVNFSLQVKPKKAVNRTLIFELVRMQPIDLKVINKKLFQRPPIIHYHNRHIHINLNAIELVGKVPVGNIKDFTMEEEKIIVKFGL